MRLSPQQKLIIAGVVALVIVGVMAWMFWWLLGRIDHARTALIEVETQIVATENEREHAHHSETIFKARAGDVAHINQIFVDHKNPVALFEGLEELARRTSTSISLSEGEQNAQNATLGFRLSIQGNLNNVLLFERLLELMPYQIEIIDLSLQRGISGTIPIRSNGEMVQLFLTINVRIK